MSPGRWTDRGSARGICAGERGKGVAPSAGRGTTDEPAQMAVTGAPASRWTCVRLRCRVPSRSTACACGRARRTCAHTSLVSLEAPGFGFAERLDVLVPHGRRERPLDDDVRRDAGSSRVYRCRARTATNPCRDRAWRGAPIPCREPRTSRSCVRPSSARKLPFHWTRCRSKHHCDSRPPSMTSAGVNGSSNVRSRNAVHRHRASFAGTATANARSRAQRATGACSSDLSAAMCLA